MARAKLMRTSVSVEGGSVYDASTAGLLLEACAAPTFSRAVNAPANISSSTVSIYFGPLFDSCQSEPIVLFDPIAIQLEYRGGNGCRVTRIDMDGIEFSEY